MDALLERLEDANEGSRELDEAIGKAVGHIPVTAVYTGFCPDTGHEYKWDQDDNDGEGPYEAGRAGLNYTTSLDAALTLVPEGWSSKIEIGHCFDGERRYCHCTLDHDADTVGRDFIPGEPFDVEATNTPSGALAVCTAAIKARNIHAKQK